eukprot:CAMPEP_0204196796 /NCGR_PEP_ID=MMETSP0361-20130328/64098_1 /ASSEMBLY_ACC=CAM_ASM_000343 /TAXON_ID=268821 /ORGANISM="Scrippsiella Hangoei, Strain SHTV-5" /LENGTH=59 /DNA_ID=CAMNT_0051158611 /DNA_START=166 /DNA_END=342 /DNA_ORIENTATION=-
MPIALDSLRRQLLSTGRRGRWGKVQGAAAEGAHARHEKPQDMGLLPDDVGIGGTALLLG